MSQQKADIQRCDSILPAPTIITRIGRLVIVTSSHEKKAPSLIANCTVREEFLTPKQSLKNEGIEE